MGQPVTAQRARATHLAGTSGLGSTRVAENPYDAPQELYQVDSITALKVFQHTQLDIFIELLL